MASPERQNEVGETANFRRMTMKLSEAILLGSTMSKQIFGHSSNSSDGRCALNAATDAAGVDYFDIDSVWPWQETLRLPCPECGEDRTAGGVPLYVGHIIAMHLNDQHRWPLAKIAEWVRSIEPRDECADGGQGPVEAVLEEVKV